MDSSSTIPNIFLIINRNCAYTKHFLIQVAGIVEVTENPAIAELDEKNCNSTGKSRKNEHIIGGTQEKTCNAGL